MTADRVAAATDADKILVDKRRNARNNARRIDGINADHSPAVPDQRSRSRIRPALDD